MKSLVLALTFVFAPMALAGTTTDFSQIKIPVFVPRMDGQGQFGIPAKDLRMLERLIEGAVVQEIGWDFKDFRVDWSPSSLKCTETPNEMDDGALIGVCTVSFGAWQLEGKAVIVKKSTSYAVVVLYANIE